MFADASAILMRSSRLLAQPTLPSTIAEPKNKKQQLRNDVISFLSNKYLKWHGSEIPSSGEAFVKAMVDTFWVINGHKELPYSVLFRFLQWVQPTTSLKALEA